MDRPRPDVLLGTTALGLIAGVLAASHSSGAGAWAVWGATAALVARRTRGVALAILAGAVLASPLVPVRLPGVYEIEGTVQRLGQPFRGRRNVTFHIERIGRQPRSVRARIGAASWLTLTWRPGTRVRAVVRLKAANQRGQWVGALPGGQAIHFVLPPVHATGPLVTMRASAAGTIDRALPRDRAALVRAMVLGDRTDVSREDRERFRQTGQAHLLAVSGLHVGLWLIGLLVVLRLFGLGPRTQALAALLAVGIYVPLTGWPPSAVRAGCAVALHLIGRLMGRAPAPLVVVTLVAVTLTIVEPRSAFEVAFQLSFSAVLGILLLTQPIAAVLIRTRLTIPGLLAARRAPLRRSLAVSLAAWMGTLPVVASAIGQAAPAGPLIAVAAIPLTALVLLSSMALLALGWIPGVDGCCAALAQGAIDLLCMTLDGARTLGVAAYPIRAPSLPALLVYAGACAVLVRARSRRSARRALLVCGALITAWWIGTAPSSATVHGYHPRSVTASLPLLTSPLRAPADVAILAGVLVVLAFLTVRMRWLTVAGAVSALGLGMLAGWTFGAPGLGALGAPFLVATVLGKLPGHARAGARNERQVLSNGVPAALGCVLALAGWPTAGIAFFLGGLACLGSDSCATEVGVRYGGAPWSLTGVKVRQGESGGVTIAGTLAALGGSVLAPLGWAAFASFDGAGPAIVSVAAAGFAGSLLDSVLGSTVQFRGRLEGSDEVVEATQVDGVATRRVRGLQLIDNDAVNLLSGLAAAAAAVALWHLGFGGWTG